MKHHGRILWAVAMTAATVTTISGYTLAVARQEPGLPTLPPSSTAETASEPAPTEPLLVVLRDDTEEQTILTITDSKGKILGTAEKNILGEYLLELEPGQRYEITSAEGLETAFYLEDNAAVSNVTGNGWTDGEQLHLDTEIRCTLRILRAGGTECLYTLTGGDVAEQRALYTETGSGQAQAVFAGLEPGTYTLSSTDGLLRTVSLTAEQPEVVLGLD